MRDLISIPVSHVKFLVPGYKRRITEIHAQIDELLAEKSELETILGKYSEEVDGEVERSEHIKKEEAAYDPNSSWWAKVYYILRQSESALTTAEVVDKLILIDDKIDRSKMIRIVSSTLGTKANSGVLTRFKAEGKDQSFSLAK